MNQNTATSVTQMMNETIEFCVKCARYNEYNVYRPLPGVIAHRNAALCRVMNYGRHQAEY